MFSIYVIHQIVWTIQKELSYLMSMRIFVSMHGEPEMIYFTVFIGPLHKRFGLDMVIIVQYHVKHFIG